jgi:hypothetical protein
MIMQVYIWLRWVRLTTRRYGATYVVRVRRVRHAGVGRGIRNNPWARAHGGRTEYCLWSTELVATLRQERALRERWTLAG